MIGGIIWIYIVTHVVVSSRNFLFKEQSPPSTLILTHVVFRHGNRTPEVTELYPKDPYRNYTYYPFGRGQLTNAGKRREYSVGKELRDRYGDFLGPDYYPEIVDAVSTNYNRTKMSLLLVLAGLFPPKGVEVWNNFLNWQPVPYNYLPQSKDKEWYSFEQNKLWTLRIPTGKGVRSHDLGGHFTVTGDELSIKFRSYTYNKRIVLFQVLLGTLCKNYEIKYNEVVASPKMQAEYNKNKDVFNYISKNSGLNVTTFLETYKLFFGLSTEEEWGFRLPLWTRKVWPENITNFSVKEYYVSTATTDLKKMASGYHVKKIINDTEKKIKNQNEVNGTKIYLYSAHENNLAQLLILLDIKVDHVPTYGSYIVFEIHRINKIYGVKIYYQNHLSKNIKLLKLPACEELCPWDKFQSLVAEYIPSEELCDGQGSEPQETKNSIFPLNLIPNILPKK